MFLDFVFCVLQDWIISFVYVAYMYMNYMEFVIPWINYNTFQ